MIKGWLGPEDRKPEQKAIKHWRANFAAGLATILINPDRGGDGPQGVLTLSTQIR